MAKRRAGPTLIQRSRAESPQRKALWHSVQGAGRRKVKREFFDVSGEDAQAITDLLSTRLDQNLQRAG